jgi:hypothetical protein
MTTYTVHARPWEHGWELHIDGVGVTQSEGLDDAEDTVRDYIALDLDVPPSSFDVKLETEVPGEPPYDDPALRAIWQITELPEGVRRGMIAYVENWRRQDEPGRESA